MNASSEKRGFFGYGMCNPVIKKMAKKSEENEFDAVDTAASYTGIIKKTVYFLALCLVGLALFFPLHDMFMSDVEAYGGSYTLGDIENLEGIISFRSCGTEALVFLVAAGIVLLCPLVAWLIRPLIPIVGTLYALCEGYFLGVITEALVPEYRWISFAALVITVVLVAVMLFLYKREYIKVTKKFKTVMSTLFLTSLFSGVVIFLLGLIPSLAPIVASMTEFMGSPTVSIVLSVIYIIVAALFLLVDFDVIKRCVEERMPRKYEWMAAFGLTYTVIYIYFKILNLLLQITSSGNNKNSQTKF